jgi:prepilin-type processing-associated H-X9-DG protein
MRKRPSRTTGFTLAEFLVLMGVGSLLLGILAADLTQARMKLFQQACAANLKHWGMVIDLYSQDYSGTYYGANAAGIGWSDVYSPYGRYLGTNSFATMRNMRVCPFIAQFYSQDQIINGAAGYSYSMPDPQAVYGGAPLYRTATGATAASTSPYVVTDPSTGFRIDLPTLRTVPNLSTFLLLMDGGNSMRCGQLSLRATSIPSSGPAIRPCDRHGGNVNCLFGDFHVGLVSTNQLRAQDDTGGCAVAPAGQGNPWFSMN